MDVLDVTRNSCFAEFKDCAECRKKYHSFGVFVVLGIAVVIIISPLRGFIVSRLAFFLLPLTSHLLRFSSFVFRFTSHVFTGYYLFYGFIVSQRTLPIRLRQIFPSTRNNLLRLRKANKRLVSLFRRKVSFSPIPKTLRFRK